VSMASWILAVPTLNAAVGTLRRRDDLHVHYTSDCGGCMQVGWLYRRVSGFVANCGAAVAAGVVEQGLAAGLQVRWVSLTPHSHLTHTSSSSRGCCVGSDRKESRYAACLASSTPVLHQNSVNCPSARAVYGVPPA
jgi:hypothetical protein